MLLNISHLMLEFINLSENAWSKRSNNVSTNLKAYYDPEISNLNFGATFV